MSHPNGNSAGSEAASLRVESDLGHGFVRLLTAEAERRQAAHDIRSCEDIVIELLRNSRDAGSRHIFLATSKELDGRRIAVIDDGCGVPQALFSRIFEPRVTSKLDTVHMDKWGVHGRGMALYSIAVNASNAAVADSLEGGGTAIVVDVDGRRLKERKDQSTFPSFRLDDRTGSVVITGPRNIARTACEFALDSRSRCQVFFGSPTEIAASLLALGRRSMGSSRPTMVADPRTAPLCSRLALASAPDEFAAVAAGMGLRMSTRSARRVLDGTIAAVPPLSELVAGRLQALSAEQTGTTNEAGTAKAAGKAAAKPAGGCKRQGAQAPRFDERDLESFGEKVVEAFDHLAQSYYLSSDVTPSIKVSKGELVVRIPLG